MVEFQGYHAITDVIIGNMRVGMFNSHYVLCVDFIVSEEECGPK